MQNMMYIKGVLLQWFINFFDKKSALLADKSASCGAVKNENMSNQRPLELATQELAEELHKLIIIKFEKLKVCSSFIDNIWGAELADMR